MLTNLDGSPITLSDLRGAYVRAMTMDGRAKRMAASAKDALRKQGWNIQKAATAIGCTRQHLSLVLNGNRRSAGLLAAVHGLPSRRFTSAQMIELLARMDVKA
jgi:hypothetical protein